MLMSMHRFFTAVDMSVGVQMGMLMGMGLLSMTMGVGVGMRMLVGMLEGNGIFDHQNRRDDHNSKTEIKLESRTFTQHKKTEKHTEEGCNGIISTGLRRTQIFLGLDVKIDAQAISNKTQKQHSQKIVDGRQFLSNYKCHDQAAQTGENTLDGCDLYGGLGTEHTGAVILQSPAAGCTHHQQRAGIETEAAFPFETKGDTGNRHQKDGEGEPLGQNLFEHKKRDQGGCHNLEVIQQGSIGGIGALEAQHQQNRRCNIQHDHAQGKR